MTSTSQNITKEVDIFAMFGQVLYRWLSGFINIIGKFIDMFRGIVWPENKYTTILWIATILYIISSFLFYHKNPLGLFQLSSGVMTIIMVCVGAILCTLILTKDITNIGIILSHLLYFGKLLLFLACIFAIASFGMSMIFNITNYITTVSSFINLFIGVLVLTLVYIYFKNKLSIEKQHVFIKLITKIIFYIPCLVIEIINFLKKDYKETPSVTIVILILLTIFITISIILPVVSHNLSNSDSVQLIQKPLYLNEAHFIISHKDLMEKLHDSVGNTVENSIYSFYDKNLSPDTDKENFAGDKHVVYDYESNRFKDITEGADKIGNETWRQIMINDPELAKELAEFMKTPNSVSDLIKRKINEYLTAESTPDTIKKLHTAIKQSKIDIKSYNTKINETVVKPYMKYHLDNTSSIPYQYGISMWIFIDDKGANISPAYGRYTSLFNYGNKPTILYHGANNEMIIQTVPCKSLDDKKCKSKTVFKTKEILYQRWNHIVLNADGSNLDIFINNNLVGSTPHSLPYLNEDNIIVGTDNGIHGGICNLAYYKTPLSKSNINYMYQYFKNKDPPIFK